jgi:putative addiction module killer protein
MDAVERDIRIYFGQDGLRLVILLNGGDKHTQAADIQAAKSYWDRYKQEKRHGNR